MKHAVIPALPTPRSDAIVVLYQYEACPFCNKVRAHLDWRRVPYVVVEVDPLFKGTLGWSEYKKVPVAVVNGTVVVDSGRIIDAVEEACGAGGRGSGGKGGSVEEGKWREWADSVLVRHLTINIYRNASESLETFDYLTQRNFPAWSAIPCKYIGAAAMWAVAIKRRKEFGIDNKEGAERVALGGALDELMGGMGGQPFLGGDHPNLADVTIYGVMRSIKGLPTWKEAIMGHAGAAAWVKRMEVAVGGSMLLHRAGEK